VETYWTRWRRFLAALRPRREELGQLAERLARAEAQLLDAEALTPERREERIVERAERAIARHWRHRPCPALKGARLPKIAGGGYFCTPADAIHWLDLDPELVAEALHEELKPRGAERHHAHPSGDDDDDPALLLLVSELCDRLFEDPVGTVAGQLFSQLVSRVTKLAHRGETGAARRRAAAALSAVFAALRADRRSHRPHRGREREDKLDRLKQAVGEEQQAFREYCATLEPGALPPPLREAGCILPRYATRSSEAGLR